MKARFACLLSFACLYFLNASPAEAGITIHYEGHARDSAAVDQILEMARVEAKRNGWTVADASLPRGTLDREIGGEQKPYTGPVRGVVLIVRGMCEPVHLQFGSDLFLQDFVKTQFGGVDVHIRIVSFFRKIGHLFADMTVVDEGEYWRSSNRSKLETIMKELSTQLREYLRSHPAARGPVKLMSGRIVDLVE